MRFKEYLKESVEEPFITDPDEIANWLEKYNVENYTIRNGIVDVRGSVHLIHADIDRIPFKFGIVSGYFDIDNNPLLTSLRGSPDSVGRYFSCQGIGATSLEHAPRKIGGLFNSWSTPIRSLKGIHEHIHRISNTGNINRFIMSFDQVKEGGIGLLLIEGVRSLLDEGEEIDDLPVPFQTIHQYLGRPNDLFECQAELIDLGYEAFAEL